eukprot:6177032-Pleurochrysis_carterae.AAC.1
MKTESREIEQKERGGDSKDRGCSARRLVCARRASLRASPQSREMWWSLHATWQCLREMQRRSADCQKGALHAED